MVRTTLALAIALVTMLAATRPARAASCSLTQCSGTVSRLYASADGSNKVLVQLAGAANPGCTLEGGYFTLLATGTPAVTPQATYSLLLAAYLSGKSVLVRYANGSTGCTILYVTSPS